MTTLLFVAFGAGMVSTANPCGFAMLPAYLGYFLGDDGRSGTTRVAAMVASGFLAVFAIAGLLIGLGLRTIVDAIPWLALVVGFGLMVLGISQVFGKRLVPYLRGPSRVRKRRGDVGVFTFGMSYAIASLSCTLPIFLSLVSGAIAADSAIQAILTFVAYGAGMSTVVVGLTILVARGRKGFIARIRPLASKLDAVSGWIMTLAGAFIVWYWATVLSAGAATLGESSLVRTIDRVSAMATNLVGENPIASALVVGGLVAAFAATRRTEDRSAEDSEPTRAPSDLAP